MGFVGKLLSINYTDEDNQTFSFYGMMVDELPSAVPSVSIGSEVIDIRYLNITPEMNSDNTQIRLLGEIKTTSININKFYLHFITLTGNTVKAIYLQIYTKRSTSFNINTLKGYLRNRKVICTANMGAANNLIPLYVSGEDYSLRFYYYSTDNPDNPIYTSVEDYNITDIISEVD